MFAKRPVYGEIRQFPAAASSCSVACLSVLNLDWAEGGTEGEERATVEIQGVQK